MKDMPQIQQGDIIRVEELSTNNTSCRVVNGDKQYGIWVDCGASFVNVNTVVAIYRFDGRDFRGIWERDDYAIRNLFGAIAKVKETMDESIENIKGLNEILSKYNKKAGDKE